MTQLSPSRLSEAATVLYADGDPFKRTLQRWRPFICPFHLLLNEVPSGARILDIGCGAGLFLALLTDSGRISQGYGFDFNYDAVKLAQHMLQRLPAGKQIRIENLDATGNWPEEQFDVVSMIDVLHHVPPDQQQSIILKAAQHVAPGGIFLYKDMVTKPRWRAWANRFHDLIMAREWIHYVKLAEVCQWLEEADMKAVGGGRLNMLWYGHEWVTYRGPNKVEESG